MKIIVPVCILCESEKVQLWTLDISGVDDQKRFLGEIGGAGLAELDG